jgi:hypothetical protein
MKGLEQSDSVEFSVENVDVPYLFRIWHIHPHSNVILIRKDSNILPHLQVGAEDEILLSR